jgi:predicted acyltransferase (DUF342 family)
LSATSNLFKSIYVKGFVDISGGDFISRNGNLNIAGNAVIKNNTYIQNQLGVGVSGSLYQLDISGRANFRNTITALNDVSINGNLYLVTPATNDNSVKAATTAYVQNQNYATLTYLSQQLTSVQANPTFSGTLTSLNDISLGGNITGAGFNFALPPYTQQYSIGSFSTFTNVNPTGGALNTSCRYASCSNTGQYVLAQAGDVNQYISSNYGVTWTITGGAQYSYQSTISSTGQYAIIPGSNLVYSNNYGVSFNQAHFSSNGATTNGIAWNSAAISSDGTVALASGNGHIYYSTNQGQTWTVSNAPNQADNAGGLAISSNGQYSVTSISNVFYYSSNYGVSWTAVSSMPNLPVNYGQGFGVTMSGSGQYAVACLQWIYGNGQIFYSSNYGQTWTAGNQFSFGGFNPLLSMTSSGQYVYLNGQSGYYYSADYGHTWTAVSTVSDNLWTVVVSGDGTHLYVGSSSYSFYRAVANTVNVVSGPSKSTFNGLLIANDVSINSRLFVGQDTSLNGNLYVANNSILNGNVIVNNSLTVTNKTFLNSDLSLSGNLLALGFTAIPPQYSPIYTIGSFTTYYPDGNNAHGPRYVGMSANGQYMLASQGTSGGYSTNYGVTWTSNGAQGSVAAVSFSSTGQYAIYPGSAGV